MSIQAGGAAGAEALGRNVPHGLRHVWPWHRKQGMGEQWKMRLERKWGSFEANGRTLAEIQVWAVARYQFCLGSRTKRVCLWIGWQKGVRVDPTVLAWATGRMKLPFVEKGKLCIGVEWFGGIWKFQEGLPDSPGLFPHCYLPIARDRIRCIEEKNIFRRKYTKSCECGWLFSL